MNKYRMTLSSAIVLLGVLTLIDSNLFAGEKTCFSPADLVKYRNELDWQFGYPRTAETIEALLGSQKYNDLMDERTLDNAELTTNTSNVEKVTKEGISTVWSYKHKPCNQDFSWFDKSGSAIFSTMRDCKIITNYTNDDKVKEEAPQAFRAWTESIVSYVKLKGNTPEIQWRGAFREMDKGLKICGAPYSDWDKDFDNFKCPEGDGADGYGFAVSPVRTDGRTYFHKNSDENIIGSSGGGAYLVAGDLVEVRGVRNKLFGRNGMICATYQNLKGKRTSGWISANDLVMVSSFFSSPKYRIEKLQGKLPPPATIFNRIKSDRETLQLEKKANGEIRFVGNSGGDSGEDPDSVSCAGITLKFNGRLGMGKEGINTKNPPSIYALLLNNAVLISSTFYCNPKGYDEQIYYPSK